MERETGIEPASLAWKAKVLPLNYSRLALLNMMSQALSPVVTSSHCLRWWRRLDSNQRRRKPTDLQSAPFSRSGISPRTEHFLLFIHHCQSVSPLSTSENAQTVGVWASHIGARQLPTFTRVIRTIIGVESFHGPVRDGKGWFQLAMVTGRRG